MNDIRAAVTLGCLLALLNVAVLIAAIVIIVQVLRAMGVIR